MEISFKRTFIKDIKRLSGEFKNKIEKIVFEIIPEASNINEIQGVTKIKGYKNYYRILTGNIALALNILKIK